MSYVPLSLTLVSNTRQPRTGLIGRFWCVHLFVFSPRASPSVRCKTTPSPRLPSAKVTGCKGSHGPARPHAVGARQTPFDPDDAAARSKAMVDSEEAVAEALLKAVGVDDHEPEVVGMVLDAMHRAARDALGDARDLALHSNETKIEAHDVRAGDDLMRRRVAIRWRPPPARENAIAAAASVNAAPLSLADGHGVRLPREGNLTTRDHSLEARNDDLEHGLAA